MTTEDLIVRFLKGDRRALARILSWVEELDERAFDTMSALYNKVRGVDVVGVTGPAGAGKSSLINQLIMNVREKERSIGVLAVDPTSPYTGGAVLGDRVRMQRHYDDPNVFIRSIGSRGRSGGLSFSTRALLQVLDAFGIDELLLETVGAGQTETDVMDLAKTTLVVITPESGDAIQALKAGILEIADIYVVNKADRDGAERIANEIRSSISMSCREDGEWVPPLVLTEAINGKGLDELWAAIEAHRTHLHASGEIDPEKLQETKEKEFSDILMARMREALLRLTETEFGKWAEGRDLKGANPYGHIDQICHRLLSNT